VFRRRNRMVPPMPNLLAILLFSVLSLTSALAAPPERPAPGEVIDQVAKYTGLTNDTVSLALKDNAAALGRLTDAVQALQIAQQFLDAKNADIAATVFWSATDAAAEKLLPPPLMTAIKAIRVYKSILEELRDNVLIPALDQKIYEQYRAEREQNQDPVNAFDFAVTMVHGYYVVKPKMVDELIKAKGWNVDVMGERMRRLAEAQVDRFWRERMEATYQQEKAKPQKEAILAAIWGSVQDIIDQLKAPAAPLSAALFIDPSKDLPSGWWWVKGGNHSNRAPYDMATEGTGGGWAQEFAMSRASGFQRDMSSADGLWCKARDCKMPALDIVITILNAGDQAGSAALIDAHMKFGQLQRIGQHAGWHGSADGSMGNLEFAGGPYFVMVTMTKWSAERATQEIGMHFARLILERIRAEATTKGAGDL
jgi:hypothetical protein